jgi:hypothetical protein
MTNIFPSSDLRVSASPVRLFLLWLSNEMEPHETPQSLFHALTTMQIALRSSPRPRNLHELVCSH